MNVIAVVGSPRKGKATDTLVDKAIEGVKAGHPDCRVKKINLADHDIHYCRNCLTCRDADTDAAYARCVINDDMGPIYEDLLASDALILGTPVHMGSTTSLMMTFLERICWTFAKPGKRYLTIRDCPMPRSDKTRKAVIIITSGIVPPLYRRWCDDATSLIRTTIRDGLNAKSVGDMYAGDIEHRGVERYFKKAQNLGGKLARQ
jgi:FMN-dependent NADH-azoreductase